LALYRLTPLTGRKHQLRAQMNALGLPIMFDRIYPQLLPDGLPNYQRPLQLLARELRFEDPISGVARCFRSKRQLSMANQAASRT
jgi:tRNA pseudouridine32 synthase/23S rRNA pseudouridine746 synthase